MLAKHISGDFMFITLIRTSVLYIFVIAIMRMMGKRQIGELQPTELVVTLLLSEIIAIPMQDNDISLVSAIVPVLVLVGFEILISVISLKSVKIRSLMQGNSIIIIRDGKLDLKKIKELRFTIDDVLEALRQKDILEELKKPPYELFIERKALRRTIQSLVEAYQFAIMSDGTGIWIDQSQPKDI